jgi:uncharacterized OB-fold protein
VIARPAPVRDAASEGFWAAADRGQLAVQFCESCATFQHPPALYCRSCGSGDPAYRPVSGRGHLWSWTRLHRTGVAAFEAALPFTCVVVELEEQPGLLLAADLADEPAGGDALRIGLPMSGDFSARDAGGGVVPRFRRDTAADG